MNRCIDCIYYEECEDADDEDNPHWCENFISLDFTVDYEHTDRNQREFNWKEMSYNKFVDNALGWRENADL